MDEARKKRILTWVAIGLVVFGGGFAYGFSLLNPNSSGMRFQGWIGGKIDERLAPPHSALPGGRTAGPLGGILEGKPWGGTVGPATLIVTRIRYACGHEEVSRELAPPEMRGLSREELQQEVKGWKVEAFTPQEVILVQDRPGMSPRCAQSMFLGIKDGFVTVFHGTPDAPCKPKSITRIPVKGLPSREVLDLRKGIPVRDQEELLKVLEGLSSYLGS